MDEGSKRLHINLAIVMKNKYFLPPPFYTIWRNYRYKKIIALFLTKNKNL